MSVSHAGPYQQALSLFRNAQVGCAPLKAVSKESDPISRREWIKPNQPLAWGFVNGFKRSFWSLCLIKKSDRLASNLTPLMTAHESSCSQFVSKLLAMHNPVHPNGAGKPQTA